MESKVKELKDDLNSGNIQNIIKIIKNNSIPTNKIKLKKMEDLYRKYKEEKANFREIKNADGTNIFKTIEQFNKFIRQEANSISSDASELANLAVDICYSAHEKDNKQFVWYIFGNDIIDNIYNNRQDICFIPAEDPNGDIIFLENKYSLQEISFKVDDFDYENF